MMKEQFLKRLARATLLLDVISGVQRLYAWGKPDMRIMLEVGIGLVFVLSLSILAKDQIKQWIKIIHDVSTLPNKLAEFQSQLQNHITKIENAQGEIKEQINSLKLKSDRFISAR